MRRISKMSSFCSILVATLTAYNANAEECQNINAIGNAKKIVDCPPDQNFEYCFISLDRPLDAGAEAARLGKDDAQ